MLRHVGETEASEQTVGLCFDGSLAMQNPA
jgi:hypothetical protein